MRTLAGSPLILTAALISAAFPTLLQGQAPDRGAAPSTRPSWVVDGVPDTVWTLVERSAAEEDRDRTKELLIEAEREARTALETCADVGCRFALAVVLGLRANEEGGRTKVRVASDLHEELERILAVEPEHARARHMLGRLHAGIMRMNRVVRWAATSLLGGEALKDASWEEAERHLAFAEETEPGLLDHHLQLANLYRDTDRPDLALEEVGHVLERTPSSPLEVAVREEAERLLEELGDGGGRPGLSPAGPLALLGIGAFGARYATRCGRGPGQASSFRCTASRCPDGESPGRLSLGVGAVRSGGRLRAVTLCHGRIRA